MTRTNDSGAGPRCNGLRHDSRCGSFCGGAGRCSRLRAGAARLAASPAWRRFRPNPILGRDPVCVSVFFKTAAAAAADWLGTACPGRCYWPLVQTDSGTRAQHSALRVAHLGVAVGSSKHMASSAVSAQGRTVCGGLCAGGSTEARAVECALRYSAALLFSVAVENWDCAWLDNWERSRLHLGEARCSFRDLLPDALCYIWSLLDRRRNDASSPSALDV